MIASTKFNTALAVAALILIAACSSGDIEPAAATSNEAPSDNSPFNSAVQVQISSAEMGELTNSSQLRGVASAFRKATVAAEVGGRVQQRLVEPGDTLQLGQTMLVLDNTQPRNAVNEAQAMLATQQVGLASAQSEYKRGQELIEKAFISKDDLESLEFTVQRAKAQIKAGQAAVATATKALGDAQIQAPFAGTAEQVHVQEGDYLTPGVAVVTLADFSKLRVRAGVTASQALLFEKNSKALVSFDALGITPLEGVVQSIGRIADPVTGSYPLEVWLDGSQVAGVREGMVSSISIDGGSAKPTLLAPAAAVFRRAGQAMVFIVKDDHANLQAVTTGRNNSTHVEITGGLQQGQNVVVSGQFTLRDGARVDVLN